MADSAGEFEAISARNVLNDCRAALCELKRDPIGQEWRLRWVGTLALLRTVGEVLTNVDRQSDDVRPALKEEIGQFFKRMQETNPEPVIYWKFIRGDANGILHAYKFRAVQSLTLGTTEGGVKGNQTASVSAVDEDDLNFLDATVVADRSYRMKAGPFKDQDQRDVVERAIEWWEKEIRAMETRAAANES